MNFAIIDIVFAIITLVCLVHGVMQGFVREFFSKMALLAGTICGLLFYGMLVPRLLPSVRFSLLAHILAFLIIFILVYVLVRIIEKIVGLAFRGEIMRGLDTALGLFLGIIEGVLICALILLLLTAQTFFDVSAVLKGSLFYQYLSPVLFSTAPLLKKIM